MTQYHPTTMFVELCLDAVKCDLTFVEFNLQKEFLIVLGTKK